MANVRCPMCSKLNTPDAEVCSYCGARLKPVRPPSGTPAPGAPRKNEEPEDSPEWLRSLRSDTPGAEPETPSEPDAEAGDMPDWLTRIRGRTTDESQPGASEDAAEETPDWLKGLQGDNASDNLSDRSAESPASSDWFGRLQEPSPPQERPPASQPPASQPPAASSDDTPDWLRGLADETFSTAPEQGAELPSDFAAETGPAGGEEDWMSKLSSWAPGESEPAQDAPSQPSAASEEEDFSWLGGLERSEGSSGPAVPTSLEQPSREEEGFGLTGFLSQIEPPAGETALPDETEAFPTWGQEPASTGEGLPDWLGAQPSGESQPAAGADDSGLPDWIQAMGGEPSGAPAASDEPETGLPSWLGAEDAAAEPPRAGGPAAADDLPSWLEGAQPLTPAGNEDTDLPSWLSGMEAEMPSQGEGEIPAWMRADADLTPGPQATPAASDEGLPDWFASFGQTDAPSAAPEETPFGGAISYADQSAAEQPLETTPLVPQAPDFSFSNEISPAEPVSSETPDEAVPDWLRDFEAQPPAGASMPPLIDAEPVVPGSVLEGEQPFAVDLPDWLAEDEASVSETAEQPLEMSGETLAQADLPEWVKEMRPIESFIPGVVQGVEAERHAEKSGPLAGMPGILPAEELATRYRRPPVYSVKLRASEKQRTQASQFETILAQETQPLLIPTQGKPVQGLLARIVIALLLIVALALPPLMEMDPLVVPALGPDETRRMFETIEASQAPDEAVLLAVDFEPALAGEMRLAAQPVIEHLLEKNARIVVVSTRSSGPAMAEYLLDNAEINHPQFNRQENFINLGFLPGDMISLLAFAREPAFAAPATLGGELIWENPTLQEIRTIQDFSRVVVLTDTAETGRIWVEQVKPLMGDVPLLMVTSAQAAPMMAPFIQSGQVTGMVGGMLGGFLYAQWANQADTPAGGYLASYQVGVLLAFALTLIGGLFSGSLALLKRNQKDEE